MGKSYVMKKVLEKIEVLMLDRSLRVLKSQHRKIRRMFRAKISSGFEPGVSVAAQAHMAAHRGQGRL